MYIIGKISKIMFKKYKLTIFILCTIALMIGFIKESIGGFYKFYELHPDVNFTTFKVMVISLNWGFEFLLRIIIQAGIIILPLFITYKIVKLIYRFINRQYINTH